MKFEVLQNIIDIIRLKKLRKLKKITKFNKIEVPKIPSSSIDVDGKDNSIIIKNSSFIDNINITIQGFNNIVTIEEGRNINNIKLFIYGDNNIVTINKNAAVSFLSITIGLNCSNQGKVQNSSLHIDENVSIEKMHYRTLNSNTFCNIGKDCLISFDVDLYNTDGHPIYNKDTKELINKVKGIEIGNHCWLGAKTTILKNSKLPDNSILGWGSVFSGTKYNEPNCVFAGNPTKLVRKNVLWEFDGSKGYVQNEQ